MCDGHVPSWAVAKLLALHAERVAIRVGSRVIAVIRQHVAVQWGFSTVMTLPFSATGGWFKVRTVPSLNCRLLTWCSG